jgi:hypothetical protein
MSQEPNDISSEMDQTHSEGVQDTLDALNSGSETYFVSGPEKKPLNRTTIVMFLIIALGGGGLYFMHLRTGPKSAAAATTGEAAVANKTIGQFLSGGSKNIKLMETMLRSTEKVVQQFNNYPSVKQVPLSGLQTNPFRVAGNQTEEGQDEDARHKLEEQRQAVLKIYQTLQLQSIMSGGKNSSCMINNMLYREGQLVSGFMIEKIDRDAVTIKQGAWRFDLKMQK